MNTKKIISRLVSLMLSIVLVMAVLPLNALAENYTLLLAWITDFYFDEMTKQYIMKVRAEDDGIIQKIELWLNDELIEIKNIDKTYVEVTFNFNESLCVPGEDNYAEIRAYGYGDSEYTYRSRRFHVPSGNKVAIAYLSTVQNPVEDYGGGYGRLLDKLGKTYDKLDFSVLAARDNLSEYDVIFLNSHIFETVSWVYRSQVAYALKNFVENGGILFGGHHANTFINVMYPNSLKFGGRMGSSWGDDYAIIDTDLERILGKKELYISDIDNEECLIEAFPSNASVLMRKITEWTEWDDSQPRRPIKYGDPVFVSFKCGDGFIFYSSFDVSWPYRDENDMSNIVKYILGKAQAHDDPKPPDPEVYITGDPIVKETLTANTSGWPQGSTKTYQWNRVILDSNGAEIKSEAISNATKETYEPVYDDFDCAITVTVRGADKPYTSDKTKKVSMKVGYAFENSRSGFGYNSATVDRNPIGDDVYKRVFPDVWRVERMKDFIKGWRGNCYGMSMTTQLFRHGSLNTKNFETSNTNYPEIEREWQFSRPPVSLLKKEIEAYQLVQRKPAVQAFSPNSWSSSVMLLRGFLTLVEEFERGGKFPYILSLACFDSMETDGKKYINCHAVVPYRVKYPEDGSSNRTILLYVYDPNYPLDMNRAIVIAENNSFWSYGEYNSMNETLSGCFGYKKVVGVNNFLETPTYTQDSAAGSKTDGALTLNISGQNIVMESQDLEDASGTVSRYLPIGAGNENENDLFQEFFIAETKGEMSISAKALNGDVFAYLYNAYGGGILQSTSQVAYLPYTLTVNPGKSVLFDGAGNQQNTDLFFYFEKGEELLELQVQTDHTGSLKLERINDSDFKLTGNNLADVEIGDGENVFMSADSLPNEFLIRLQYNGNGEIVAIVDATTSDPNPNPTTYTVTFDPNGGICTGGGELVQTVEEGKAAISPILTRSGYTFVGWDKSFANISGNITITAQWTQNASPNDPNTPNTPNDPNTPNNSSDLNNTPSTPNADNESPTKPPTEKPTTTTGGDGEQPTEEPELPDAETPDADGPADTHDCHVALYADLDADLWYHEFIDFVVAGGLMQGVGTNPLTFAPSAKLTRAMMVQILYNMEGRPAAGGDAAFGDVPVGSWFFDAVAWAYENGIAFGYGEGKFGPNDDVTREQMVAILYRYSQYKGYDTSETAEIDTFADAASVSGWAVEAMRWAVGSRLIVGRGENDIAPKSTATRAEVATIIARFCKTMARPENGG